MPTPSCRVDNWELRCRYKWANLFQRWLNGDFRTEFGKPGNPDPESGQPPNTISQMAYYYDPTTGDQIAKVHFFWLETGAIGGADGKHDPKGLQINGVRFRQKRGPKINRDPEVAYGNPDQREAYKRFRKKCCALLGPAGDRSFAIGLERKGPHAPGT